MDTKLLNDLFELGIRAISLTPEAYDALLNSHDFFTYNTPSGILEVKLDESVKGITITKQD